MIADAFLVALQTLTRLPVPSPRQAPTPGVLALSGVFYPLVGLLPAGVGLAVSQWLTPLIPWPVGALLTLVLWALLTGALHEDGLADAADAFGSQSTKEGVLRVMKDSRVGSYGALALILVSLLRWQGLALVPGARLSAALLVSQALPRAGIVALAKIAGPATTGSGGSFAASLGWGHALAAIVAGCGIAFAVDPRLALRAAVACAVVVSAAALFFRQRIDGVTGDCLGAAFLLQEIAVLLVSLR